ncbi:MAG: phospho-N-acetylmuramoyl-pentapeptide-transferase [bacterium]|nr:phospho-N-acetylmuramoyl-pentapeptide-transferase [bacterium]
MEIAITLSAIKIILAGTLSFLFAFLITPPLTHILYTKKLWRKEVRERAIDGGDVPVFRQFHKDKEIGTPRFGGVLIWVSVPVLALVSGVLGSTGSWWLEKMSFLSRSQTWLPLATLIASSAVGFLDDILQVIQPPAQGLKQWIWTTFGQYIAGGLSFRYRFLLVAIIGLVGAWWFVTKLGVTAISIPWAGSLELGLFFIPIFVIVMLATYSGGVIDGLDGLAGGAFASSFAAFGMIAFSQGQIDLAAFCMAIVGALLAFLWFNIPPARFYMGETGVIGLTATLSVVAFLTDSVLVLPIIALPLVMESGSVIIQLLSKRFRKKKVFRAAPLHHHFEALGWPHYKITMRFWIIGVVTAFIGVIVKLLG